MKNTLQLTILFLGLIMLSQSMYGQDTTSQNQLDKDSSGVEYPFLIVEKSAEPIGGMAALVAHLNEYVKKNYPEEAKKEELQGRVYVYFKIEKDGTQSNFQILKGIGYGCDELAIEAVKSFGKWNPPVQRGRNVRQVFRLPVNFKLNQNEENLPQKP